MTLYEKITGSFAHAELPAKFAIIVAGGSGKRAGSELPKQFVEVDGVPIISYSLRAFKDQDNSTVPVVVLPEEYADYWRSLNVRLSANPETAHYAIDHYFTYGGKTRTESVSNGLEVVSALLREFGVASLSDIMVAVHDGARPYLKPDMIERGWEECRKSGSAVPVVPVIDSLRRIKKSGEGISESVERADYVAVQTPQIFRYPLLKEAYDMFGNEPGFTDDASLTEKLQPVGLYQGDSDNQKVTTPRDLELARIFLRRK